MYPVHVAQYVIIYSGKNFSVYLYAESTEKAPALAPCSTADGEFGSHVFVTFRNAEHTDDRLGARGVAQSTIFFREL